MRLMPDADCGTSVVAKPLLEISNAMVHLYKTAFGRGPTQARARFAGPDLVVVVLQETLTASERRLREIGEHQRLREQRLLLHETLEGEMRTAVERILTRPTLAVITGIDTQQDLAVETFLLAPVAPPG